MSQSITSTAQAYMGGSAGPYQPPSAAGLRIPGGALTAQQQYDSTMGGGAPSLGGGKNAASEAYAQLTRQMWADYVTQFMPFENKLIEYAADPTVVSDAMSDASSMVSDAFQAQRGASERRIRGLGLQLDADEQAAVTRSSGLSQSLADVSAQNTARDLTRARQQSIMGNPAPSVPQM